MKMPFVFLGVQVVAVEGRAGIKTPDILSKAGGINFTSPISELYTAVLLSIVLAVHHCEPESCL